MLYIQEVVLETITEATSSTEASIHSTYYHLFLSRFSNYTQYYYIILNVHHFCTFFFFFFLHDMEVPRLGVQWEP